MSDSISREQKPPLELHASQKISGTITKLFKANGNDFPTQPVKELTLSIDGILDDYHEGPTRKSGGREPWYPRGTVMRNERQLSILAPDELATIAKRLDIPELKSEWIGGNIELAGIANLSMLPPRTLLFFEGGATIKIDGDNAPCRVAGQSIAANFNGRDDLELNFAKVARNLRGLVGWVEKPGVIKIGESYEARIPPQWIYQASDYSG